MNIASILFACAVWALVIVWWLWEYVQAITQRLEGETFIQAVQRGARESALNKAAREHMFGGPVLTSVACIVCAVATLIALLWTLQGRPIGALLVAFVTVGLIVNRRLDLNKHKSWPRLNVVDRLSFRLTHAWLWPFHQFGRSRHHKTDND